MNDAAQFGIYIHWPFCAAKCPYCDFNSHVADTIDHEAWRRSYAREIAHYAQMTPGRTVTSVFFGGGTPSLMEPHTAARIIEDIHKHWVVSDDCEITLEANPTSVEVEKFRAFRSAGINRVSIGVQSFRERDLSFLGRRHDSTQAKAAIEAAAAVFGRYSFDLIYARPGQSVKDWEEELSEAMFFAGEHLSLYQLTIEKGTPFYIQHERGEFKIPEEDLAGDLYEITQAILEGAGYRGYEVSNHAKAGAESRHNLAYWRYADYVGIGPGAHGRLTLNGTKNATRGHRAPDVWMQRVEDGGHGGHDFEPLSAQDRFTECFMMGLRLREGIPRSRLEWEGGNPLSHYIRHEKIDALCSEGLLEYDKDTIRATSSGLQRLNGIFLYLLG